MSNSQGIGRNLALAVVLAVGLAVIWATVVATSASFVGNLLSVPADLPRPRSFVVFADGTPAMFSPYGSDEYFDLDGTPIAKRDRQDRTDGSQLQSGKEAKTVYFPGEWEERVAQFDMMEQEPFSVWYFLHNGERDGAGYLVGYNRLSNECLGYLAVDGWSETKPADDKWFPVRGAEFAMRGDCLVSKTWHPTVLRYFAVRSNNFPEEVVCVRSGNTIRKVDLIRKTVEVLFEDPQLTAMAQFQLKEEKGGSPEEQWGLAIRLRDRVLLHSLAGKTLAEYTIPESMRQRSFAFYAPSDDRFIYATSDTNPATGAEDGSVIWANPSGDVLDSEEFVLYQTDPREGRESVAVVTSVIPIPCVLLPLLAVLGPPEARLADRPDETWWERMGETFRQCWPEVICLLLVSGVLGWVTAKRQKQLGLPHARVWAGFVFLLGVPGYLAYVCHRRWPVRAECPVCHRSVPQDRDVCTQCDAPFPTPEPKGIEVFA